MRGLRDRSVAVRLRNDVLRAREHGYGAGLVGHACSELVGRGHRLAVLAVDPSSGSSGGGRRYRTATRGVPHHARSPAAAAFTVFAATVRLCSSSASTASAVRPLSSSSSSVAAAAREHEERALIAAAEAHAREKMGVSRASVWVISVRDDLIAWYERRRYERTGGTAPFPVGEGVGEVLVAEPLVFVGLEKKL